MKINLKEGDSFIEVDTEFPDEMIDTFENEKTPKKSENIEDTIEIKLNMENKNEINGN